ncbi:hypothetical protein AN911_16390 [Mycobacteroides immunogenum]|uniref:Uncharacterized protein n=1 Tax=Mycobacteroides immunogenum TaxID=83262 RepID=A0A7V8LPK5_9MYCO|nr:hypothetical protein TL11_23295 [Mycobacteroides immunogenum]KPG11222.1 hypothetical protein AN908_12580 [Mycobacteroides immunogenum]KPG20676.1 hypothetical protein AN911_16390 [Mycobacteroides immunogenum]KPG42573.1 hypothetical protein AN915_19825 [Mycobacteroides immunogenum]KPG50792.1 hypothetical protein AN916_18955 [Mycobacteroides immunogenum]
MVMSDSLVFGVKVSARFQAGMLALILFSGLGGDFSLLLPGLVHVLLTDEPDPASTADWD